jgi:small subunit ribosomal protein S17
MTESRKVKKIGIVVSDKNDKTIVVRVGRQFMHPLYKKVVRKHKKFMAHDEQNECKEGDVVEIIESRPLSAQKRWTLTRVIEKRK